VHICSWIDGCLIGEKSKGPGVRKLSTGRPKAKL
jgi:hypothetical protein